MADETEPRKTVRRRASRAAGPAGGAPAATPEDIRVEAPTTVKVRVPRLGPPPRRQPHRMLVAVVAPAVVLVATAVTGLFTWLAFDGDRATESALARKQQFVDTASQTVVNMFSYSQNTIDESVNRFVDGTSGPLHDMMSQSGNVDNLKAIFRDTNASSEAVVNGAALEGKVDEIAKNAAVLVSVRVTVTDLDGVNTPSRPYRLRVIVHEDDNGHMTAYDLKYPEGGN
jgi:Mce-associated membrane protein